MWNTLKALLELALESTNEGVRQEMQQMLKEKLKTARSEGDWPQWQLTEARHGELAASLEADEETELLEELVKALNAQVLALKGSRGAGAPQAPTST